MSRTSAFVCVVLLSVAAAPSARYTAGAHSAGGFAAANPAPEQAGTSIDALVAPIALYPDSLLAQILICAGDPPAVTRLRDWLKANATLKGSELQDAALLANFEPSFVALALFPQVVTMMADQPDWTKLLGQVFVADRTAVFGSIQKLRAQAQNVGTLKSTPQQAVETRTTSSGDQVIVIEPTNPQVVYVPQYNTTTVYTTAPTTTTTTVVVKEDNTAEAVAAGMIGFTAGIAIGAAVNNNYYYGPYGWHGGGYMYNDAWDDYYDHREDAREDWQDHREDLADERGDRAGNAQEQRTDRQENRTENRPESQANREQRRTDAQGQRAQTSTQSRGSGTAGATATQERTARGSTYESRGYSGGQTAQTTQRSSTADRSGTKSDAFSGYSSGKSERAASSRGSQSRSSSRSRGGGGGGRRR